MNLLFDRWSLDMTCSSMELVVSNAFSCFDETCSLDETLLLQCNLCYFDATLLFL